MGRQAGICLPVYAHLFKKIKTRFFYIPDYICVLERERFQASQGFGIVNMKGCCFLFCLFPFSLPVPARAHFIFILNTAALCKSNFVQNCF